MTMHNAEQLRQHNDYKAIQARLWGKKERPSPAPRLLVINGRKPCDASYHVVLYRAYQERLRATFSLSGTFTVNPTQEYCPYHSEIVFEPDPRPMPQKTMKQIALEVLAQYPGVTLDMVKSVRRDREVTDPRQMIMYRIRKEQPWRSFPEIGRLLNRDHSVAVHAVNKLKAELEGDEVSAAKVMAKKARTAIYHERKKHFR